MDFGAFVDILPGQSGLVHISKFVPQRIERVSDVVKEGDKIPVKVTGIDDQGRINLSAIDAGFKPEKNIESRVRASQDRPQKRGFFRR